MKIFTFALLAITWALAMQWSFARAADSSSRPAVVYAGVTGESMLGADGTAALSTGGKPGDDLVVEAVAAEGAPLERALRIATNRRPDMEWTLQVRAATQTPVRKGDVLLLTFHARGVKATSESGEAALGPCFEKAGAPFTKSMEMKWRLPADGKWRKIEIPFVALENYPAGGAQFNFRCGYAPQIVEVGGVSLLNFGDKLKPADLPRTKEPDYAGRATDAPWRKAAAERIEKNRKADLTVRVTDAAGKPLAGADVKVTMTRGAFGYGTAVNHWLLMGDKQPADRDKYREAIRKHFNKAVVENGHKWGQWAWENPDSRTMTLAAVKWLREAGLDVRGHCIIWPGWSNLPARLKALAGDKAALRAEIDKRIRDVVGANKGTLCEWDVVNEPLDNHDLMDILGQGEMTEWFRLVRQIDPAPRLFLNDYSMLSGAHVPGTSRWVKLLQDGGAPIGGIGLQGHMTAGQVSPMDMLKVLDQLAGFGLALQVTELDILTDDPQLQADYCRDLLTVMFSHPAVTGVVMWGFWDGSQWKNNGLLYSRDWKLKPAGAQWDQLLLHDWRTDAAGKADAAGQYKVRGFLGDYDITADGGAAGGKAKAVKATLAKDGATVDVKVE
jgi:endo-1,4-beta-xylanase